MPASEVTESATPSLPADDFKAIFRGHPGGVSLITADAGDGPVALTATSVASISVDPPLLVFSISALSSAAKVLTRATSLIVHSLDAHDIEVAKLGGNQWDRPLRTEANMVKAEHRGTGIRWRQGLGSLRGHRASSGRNIHSFCGSSASVAH